MNKAFNKALKMLLTGVVIAGLSSGAYARCGGGEYGYGYYGYGEHGAMMGMHPEKMEKMREEHMAALHDKLKLTSKQEGAWKKYAASKPMQDKSLRIDPAEMDKLNAPQRLEKGLEHMRAMEAKLAEHLAALKEFYAALTPEQQKTFDDQMHRGKRRGW
jgi:hypothetical protein